MYANVYNGHRSNGYAVNGNNSFRQDLAIVQQAYDEQNINGMDYAMNGVPAFVAAVAKGGVKIIKRVGPKVVTAARNVFRKIKNFVQLRKIKKLERDSGLPPTKTPEPQKEADYREVIEAQGDDEEAGKKKRNKNIIIGSSIAGGLLLVSGIVYLSSKQRKKR